MGWHLEATSLKDYPLHKHQFALRRGSGCEVALAKAIGPELQINAGPLGPSGVMPMLTPFFAFLTKPNIPPTAFLFVEPHTV